MNEYLIGYFSIAGGVFLSLLWAFRDDQQKLLITLIYLAMIGISWPFVLFWSFIFWIEEKIL